MAAYLLLVAAVALLFSPAASQTCKSQTFSQTNTTFANCTDLPTLRAQIHWTYNPSTRPNPTLTIAFIAPPARPEGWIAWALNPTATGMVGAQALVAFRDTNGSVVVKTYNISSYGPIAESRISYQVLSRRGEFSGGVMRIFATLAVPQSSVALNQVWQVGASVVNGVPARHDFSPANLGSRSTLQLVGRATDENGSPSPSPSPMSGGGTGTGTGTGTTTVPQGGNDTGGGSRIFGSGLGLYGALVLLGVALGF